MPVVSLLQLIPFPSGANNDMNATFMSPGRHGCHIHVVPRAARSLAGHPCLTSPSEVTRHGVLPWTPWPGRTGITVSNCTPCDAHALKAWFTYSAWVSPGA